MDKKRWEGGSRIMFRVNKNEKAFSPIGCGINEKYYRFLTEFDAS